MAKRFLFQLSAEEKNNATLLVPFVEKTPAFQKTGDEFTDDELKLQREQYMKCMNLMWRHPQVIAQTCSWIEGRVRSMAKQHGADFFKTLTTLKALDEDWARNYISSRCNISLVLLEQACVSDPDAWRQILVFVMCATTSLRFPKCCMDKCVMARSLDRRVVGAGGRWKFLTPDTFLTKKTKLIDWAAFGVFSLDFDKDGRAT